MGEGIDDSLLPGEVGVFGDLFEKEAVELFGAVDLLAGEPVGFGNRPRERWVGAADLRYVSSPAMLTARPGDPKQPQTRARMPPERGRPGEQQERGVGDPPLLRGLLDQAVVAECLRDRARSERGAVQEFPGKFQVEVVQGRVRAVALLVTDSAVDLLAFVDDFLRLSRHVVADAIREAVAVDHDRFGSDRHAEHEHFDSGDAQPAAAA